VKPIEHIAESAPTSKTGLFATLCGLLHVKGASASKISRGTGLLCAVAGLLAFTAAPALAASPPEAPITSAPAEVKGSTVVLQGVVNPLKSAWFFEYKAGSVCTGGSTTPVEGPEETEARPVEVRVEGLTQDTKYTVCLVAENEAKEKTVGAPVTFTTITPEPPADLEAKPIAARTATLNGVLNPNHAGETGTYEFVYKQSESECTGEEKVVAGTSAKATREPVSAPVGELLPNMPYTFCLRAKNEAGEEALSAPVTFTTLAAAPTIARESVSTVEATAATLEAEVVPEGAATTAHYEYLTEAQFDANGQTFTGATGTPQSASIGTDDSAHAVPAARIASLQPAKSYRYRVVATNEVAGKVETVDGPGKILTTNPAPGSEPAQNCPNEQLRAEQPSGLTLPDCRAYEMVSPVETNGQDATESFIESNPRASVLGDAITYASRGNFADPTGGAFEEQYISRRGSEGWSTQAITPLHQPSETSTEPSYPWAAFTPELEEGIAFTTSALPSGDGLYLADFENSSNQFLASTSETGTLMGTSSDLSHVVVGSGASVSEIFDGRTIPVSVNNEGNSMSAHVGTGAPGFTSTYNIDADVWHAVSSEGSRIFFTSPAGGSGQLYVRENAEHEHIKPGAKGECIQPAEACTVEVSASQKTNGSGPGGTDPNSEYEPEPGQKVLRPARYWDASADGSEVFFTSDIELTNDAYTGPEDNAPNLYEYDVDTEHLTDLTVPTPAERANDPEGAAVQGVVQASEDGSYVYFVAKGDLAAGAKEQQCREEKQGEREGSEPRQDNLGCNLYVSQYNSEAKKWEEPKFIATLDVADLYDWYSSGEDAESGGPERNTVAVTPAGTRLAFMSELSLTGYDNQQSKHGECEGKFARNIDVNSKETGRCREIYLYDAETNGLVCASCNPTGARPIGPSRLGEAGDRDAEYRSRNLIEAGTLFFDSSDALVPNANDGRQNVYEYEDGQIHAISDIAGGYESFFIDASANGEDVFFGTADQLLPQDTSNNVAVWDARVDGGFPVTAAAPSCDNAASCKPPESPRPAIFGAPPSTTFSGPGNTTPGAPAIVTPRKKTAAQLKAEKLAKALKSCRKDKKKSERTKCERRARSKYGAGKTKKKAKQSASTNRRAKS
jgi:hypothetical protein